MVKVIAKYAGFYGRRVYNIGDEFEVIDEEWADETRRPKWVELAEDTGEPGEPGEEEDPGVPGDLRLPEEIGLPEEIE